MKAAVRDATSAGSAEEGVDDTGLWAPMRLGDDVARQTLLDKYLPYARTVAATYYARRTHDDIAFDDYLQLARLGLLEAMERFELGRGANFITFAARHMHGSLLGGLEKLTEKSQQIAVRRRLRKERLEDAKAAATAASTATHQPAQALFEYLADIGMGLALGVMLEGTGMIDADAFGIPTADHPGQGLWPHVQYFRRTQLQELQRLLFELVRQLPPQAQAVIHKHYLEEMPFTRIAQEMALTPGRISQIHRQALVGLKERLRPSPRVDCSA